MKRRLLHWVPSFLKSRWVIGFGVIVILGGVWYVTHRPKNTYQLITVTQGPITQTVSVTGNTTPLKSVTLGFQNSGAIARVNYALGEQVSAGAVIATLDTAGLVAALQQAQANVAAQQAKLDGLRAGAQPADIAASQAALDKANQDLDNLYASIADTAADSYGKATDAVRVQLGQFFTDGDSASPKLSYTTSSSQAQNNAELGRLQATDILTKWQSQLGAASSDTTALDAQITTEVAYLATLRSLLSNVSQTLDAAPTLSAATLATYRANVTTGLAEVNAAAKNLNTIAQTIASQKATVAQAQAQLSLKQAGSTPQDIAAQAAQVEQAQASVASAEANVENAEILAPISGTITQQDAKVGQQATPGTPLVSIIAQGGFEVDAGVYETDIGKVAMGDPVSMTLDAFPGETFTGAIFYVAPAQTNSGGVITYLTKTSFDKKDPRFKSGLTANLSITTNHKDRALIVPQYAILQNDQGTFVEVLQNGAAAQVPVTLGLQDQDGNVEVLTGVTAGEQVLNIGLKTQ